MHKITFKEPQCSSLQVRSNREQLIADIVNATSETNKKSLAKRIALAANTLKWGESELHALLAKRNDPKIRNYTAFVKYSIKII